MLPLEWLVLRRLRRSLFPLPGRQIVELGVGTGANLAHHAAGTRVVALDMDRDKLLAAVKRGKRAKVNHICGDVERLPLSSSSFDAALTSLLFCSVEHPERGLAEIKRVLRPGAKLVMLEHVRGDRWLTKYLTDHLDGWWYRRTGSCHLNRETEALVEAMGWEQISSSRHGFGIFQVITAVRPGDGAT